VAALEPLAVRRGGVTASRRHGQQLHTTGSPFGAVLGDQMLPAERTATLLGRSGRVAGRELVRELVERDLAQADLAAVLPIIGAGGGNLVLLSQAAGHLGGSHREFDLLTRSFTGDAVATPYGPYGLFAASPVIPAGGVAFVPSIPEPTTWLLMALGLGLLAWRARSHARTHARTHAQTHAHTYAHTHAHTHARPSL